MNVHNSGEVKLQNSELNFNTTNLEIFNSLVLVPLFVQLNMWLQMARILSIVAYMEGNNLIFLFFQSAPMLDILYICMYNSWQTDEALGF